MSDEIGRAMIYALMLLLPLSALAARRLPMATTIKYAAAWVALFGIGFLLISAFT